MKNNAGQTEYERVVNLLRRKLGNKETCKDVIDGYDEVLQSIWTFTARLLGDGGAKAVLNRSIQLAAKRSPLTKTLRTTENGVKFEDFRSQVDQLGCGSNEVMEALTQLGVAIFTTLSELTGEALTEPLLRHLEQSSS